MGQYDDWQIDDPGLFLTEDETWAHGHFAGLSRGGLPRFFPEGTTSWTYWMTGRRVREGKIAKRPEARDLERHQFVKTGAKR